MDRVSQVLQQLQADLRAEQQRRIAEKALRKPRNDEELYEWVRDVLGYRLTRTVTKEGHRSPFEFLSDAFFEREKTLVVRATRGGGKTLIFAIFNTATTVFKDGIEVVHVGGTELQSRDGYAYYAGDGTGMIHNPLFGDIIKDTKVTETVLKNKSKLEIRTGGSAKSVSGPHPQILTVDELDHIEPFILDTALQMPMSSDEYPATVLMGSSQYHQFGTMQDMIDSAEERRMAVYEFDILDIMKPCGRKYPNECGDCPLFEWVNPYSGDIEELCEGRGSISDGHYAYEDVVQKFLNTTPEKFALQNLLLTSSAQGLMYPQYSARNRKPFPPEGADLTHWIAYAGVDQRSRGRIVVVAESPDQMPNGNKKRWVIEEWSNDSSTPSTLRAAARDIKQKVLHEFGLHVSMFWMERTADDEAKDWRTAGMPARIIPKEVGSVMYGIGTIRDLLRDQSNIISLYVDSERCPEVDHVISKVYHCKKLRDGTFDRDQPGKEGSDYADALRYAIVGGPVTSARLPEVLVGSGAYNNKWKPY